MVEFGEAERGNCCSSVMGGSSDTGRREPRDTVGREPNCQRLALVLLQRSEQRGVHLQNGLGGLSPVRMCQSGADSNYPWAEDRVLSRLLSALRVSFSNGGNSSPVRTPKSPPDEYFRWSATPLSLQGTPHLRVIQISRFPILHPFIELLRATS